MAYAVFKYIAWILATGIAFAGTWLVDYVKVDEANGKKRFTNAGKAAFGIAALSAAAGCYFMIADDLQASNDRARALAAEAEASQFQDDSSKSAQRIEELSYEIRLEQDRSSELQQKVSTQIDGIESLLEILDRNADSLPPDAKEEVGRILNSIEDIENFDPTRYENLVEAYDAGDFDSAVSVLNDILSNNMNRRFKADNPNCSEKFVFSEASIAAVANVDDLIGVMVSVRSAGVYLLVSPRVYPAPQYGDGITIIFADEGVRVNLTCEVQRSTFCSVNLSEAHRGVQIQERFQKSRVSAFIPVDPDANPKRIDFSDQSAEEIRSFWNCVNPS